MRYSDVKLFSGTISSTLETHVQNKHWWLWPTAIIAFISFVVFISIFLYCCCLRRKMKKHVLKNGIYKAIDNRKYKKTSKNEKLHEMAPIKPAGPSKCSIFDEHDSRTIYNKSFQSAFDII